MKLALINGSPRNKSSNSELIVHEIEKGWHSVWPPSSVSLQYLADRHALAEHARAFIEADIIILVFPLYTDSMPGIVKEFLELVSQLQLSDRKKLGFVIHSGFPESVHSVCLEAYLEKYTKRIHCLYMGTLIKPGSEGIRLMSPRMNAGLFKRLQKTGVSLAQGSRIPPDIIQSMKRPYKLGLVRRLLLSCFSKTGITDFYWKSQLKKYNAYNERSARPFNPRGENS